MGRRGPPRCIGDNPRATYVPPADGGPLLAGAPAPLPPWRAGQSSPRGTSNRRRKYKIKATPGDLGGLLRGQRDSGDDRGLELRGV